MAIKCKMYVDSWQIEINEIWGFKDFKEFKKALDVILEMKEKHGRIKDWKRINKIRF